MLFGAIGTLISFAVISLATDRVSLLVGFDMLCVCMSSNSFKKICSQSWKTARRKGLLFHQCAIGLLQQMDINLAIGEYLALGAIFAATDSVCTLQVLNQDETPLLYSLVFGEGVVNDATSVVLFNAVQNLDLTRINTTIALKLFGNFLYLFITSTILGVVAGLLSAYVIKKLYVGRHSTDREVAIMMLLAYLSYMISELFNLSAILTVFFCGIVMSHYTWYNVTENSRVTTKHTFATLSFVAEIFIFLYVGMDALDIEKWRVVSSSLKTSISVSGILMGLVLVGRAAFIFPLSFLSNLTKKSPYDKIDFKKQITIWWAGLMRGAVSMALAYKQFTSLGHTNVRENAIMITSTITVVLFSTVVFGLITKPLVRFLLTDLYGQSITHGQTSEASGVGQNVPHPNSLWLSSRTVHYYWRKFDNAFMRPVFGGRGFVPFVPGSPTERSAQRFPEELEKLQEH
ncbi:unnamed protein product [Fraxinus pennsylvanica]|uniref:Cation/H+ exchanger transmembrane domain-containing protein n=1 Tax=Fraxinus pennsylvanica TaxID=56036 RepID=A0AAD1ZK67_9LAMI|nr:unnamed protein product [Fraxinus pennsylvanica]